MRRSRYPMKMGVILKGLVLCAAAAMFLCACGGGAPETAAVPTEPATQTEGTLPPTTEPEAETDPVPTEPRERRYTLTFVGDCTLGGTPQTYHVPMGFVKTVGEDYGYPFANVISYFENDDFTFVNLEGTLTEEGTPQNPKFSFRGPTDFVRILTENSVEAVTLANNHTMDYGQVGFDSTKRTLEEAGIPYVEPNGSTVVTLPDGLTIGIYATTYASENAEAVVAGVRALREQGVDVVIYAAHWGFENNYHATTQQRELAHAAVDAGADIVYGSHPHVLEEVEEYGGGVILYSMGNFAFGGNGGPKDMDTALIQQEVIIGADGTVSLGQRTVVPCSVSSQLYYNNFQPTPYAVGSAEYERVLRKLNGTYP